MSSRGLVSSLVDYVLGVLNSRVPNTVWRKSVKNLPEADVDSNGVISAVHIHCVTTGKKTRKSSGVCVSLFSGRGLQFKKE